MVKLNLIPDETPKTLEGRVGTRLEANSVLYKKMAKKNWTSSSVEKVKW